MTQANSENCKQMKYLICYYYSILQYSENILQLLENDNPISIPVITRSAYEAMIDFIILKDDPSHIDALDELEKKDLPRKFSKYLDSNHPGFLKKITENQLKLKPITIKNKHEKIDSLLEAKQPHHSNEQSPSISSMVDSYNERYTLFCMHTHNSPTVLELRHFNNNKIWPSTRLQPLWIYYSIWHLSGFIMTTHMSINMFFNTLYSNIFFKETMEESKRLQKYLTRKMDNLQ